MAVTYPDRTDQEQTQPTTPKPARFSGESEVEPAVGIYERPERRSSLVGAIVLLIVLLILAYFVMQWIF